VAGAGLELTQMKACYLSSRARSSQGPSAISRRQASSADLALRDGVIADGASFRRQKASRTLPARRPRPRTAAGVSRPRCSRPGSPNGQLRHRRRQPRSRGSKSQQNVQRQGFDLL
jgi:hypothetical protein